MIILRFTKTIGQILTVLGAAVILLWVVSLGIGKGKSLAISRVTASNALNIDQGLKYFYTDQDRFPSAVEFNNAGSVILNYYSAFPATELKSDQCPQVYQYQRVNTKHVKLNFCLPVAWENFSSGWNVMEQDAVRQ